MGEVQAWGLSLLARMYCAYVRFGQLLIRNTRMCSPRLATRALYIFHRTRGAASDPTGPQASLGKA